MAFRRPRKSPAAKVRIIPTCKGSAFVPHDLAQPIHGAQVGPLAGLTAAVKDMYDIAGERTGGGSPEWLDARPPAKQTAAAVQRLLDAGATVIGKTVCDEFFYSVTGANAHYGTPVNPRAPGRLPGGSSAGSAAATAAGACDFALGSDTGGSVRIPAALCGIYGMRPTHGRVDLRGVMAMAPSFDVAGWFAVGPGLLRNIGGVLLGEAAEGANIARLLVPGDAFDQADDEIARAARSFLQRISHLLPVAEPITIAPGGFDAWRNCFRTVQGYEVWQHYGEFITARQPRLGPGIRERMAYAATVTRQDAEAARATMTGLRAQLRRLIEPGTLVYLPTAPGIAPQTSAPADALDAFRTRVMALTCIAGIGGLPQVTLPIGTVAGCPVGASLIGWAGGDEALLALAVALGAWCGA